MTFISVAAFLVVNFLIIMPVMTVIIYESVFNRRYETASWLEYSVSDFDGLEMIESSFLSNDGQVLAGYHYSKAGQQINGVVVLAHGLGCGGQNTFMPFADYFTSNGYLVFAYDATGNGNSEGETVNGLPQGVIDLDHALRYVKEQAEYKDLPIVLLGHSWGAYSAGAVLNLHPDVEAVVMISGPDRSIDLMVQESKKAVGPLTYPVVPYLSVYEWLQFGEYASYSAMDGFENSDAGVMVVQSMDDTTVTPVIGYDMFYGKYSDSPRFKFISYEDRGHDYLFYSDASEAYRDQINEDYIAYVESNGGEYNAEIKEEFMDKYLDKSQCFELDPELMYQILALYDSYCIAS